MKKLLLTLGTVASVAAPVAAVVACTNDEATTFNPEGVAFDVNSSTTFTKVEDGFLIFEHNSKWSHNSFQGFILTQADIDKDVENTSMKNSAILAAVYKDQGLWQAIHKAPASNQIDEKGQYKVRTELKDSFKELSTLDDGKFVKFVFESRTFYIRKITSNHPAFEYDATEAGKTLVSKLGDDTKFASNNEKK